MSTSKQWRVEIFIDEPEKRCWFLFEASRGAERGGH